MKNETAADDMGLVYLGMAALAAAAVGFAWHLYHPDIAYAILKWGWLQLTWVQAFLPARMLAGMRQAISLAAAHPEATTPAELHQLLGRVGRLFIAIPMSITAYGITRAMRHPANRSRRGITPDMLPRIMSSHSPAVIPVLYYGDLLNSDPEEHKRALNPEEWIGLHGLVVNGKLQRAQCKERLVRDLGQRVDSVERLSSTERAMFAIFGARLLADGRDTARSQLLLDALNRSCHRGQFQGRPGYPDLSVCDAAFSQYAAHPEVDDLIARHPYPRTLLHAMHLHALRFGKLPSSHFRWLKGMDRPLWYALNTTGRKAPFIESAAVFAQAMWEQFAADNGYVLDGPCLDGVVDGIEQYLKKIGIVKP